MFENAAGALCSANPRLDMKGIITVLNTPFAASGQIDHDAYAQHIEYALAAGVNGFLAPAMAGEAGKLTREERIELIRTLLAVVRGRVPVIGCATRHPV
ncbi:MAG TPA: hypothetical protein ENN29_09140, partial [Candidatus Hydrogenedentes bacterium]|nr:hypothetical protein [Candidatus Hydrogenedentota bacterium]